MIYYRTTLTDNSDGKSTSGTCYVWNAFTGHWRYIGTTNNFRTYPRDVRARNAARRLAFKDATRRNIHLSSVDIVEE